MWMSAGVAGAGGESILTTAEQARQSRYFREGSSIFLVTPVP